MAKIPARFVVAIFISIAWLNLQARGGSMPMADHVPADAVIYLGWAGGESQAEAFQASHLHAFLTHSNLPELAREFVPKLWDKVSAASADPDAVESLKKAMDVLLRHPWALYASGVSINADGTPNADVALVCEAGTEAANLRDDLNRVINGDFHLHVMLDATTVILGVDRSAKKLTGPSLAEQSAFKSVMNSLQGKPTIALYVDAKTILQKANESADTNEKTAAIWPKVRDALGVSSINTFAMTAGFDGMDWSVATTLDAPAPRIGLLAAVESKPIDPVLLARIPSSADFLSVCNFDVAKLIDTVALAMASNPESDKVFHQAMGLATLGLGRNLRQQIVAPLGSQWVIYSDAALHTTVVLNHPSDADAAGDALVSATFGLVNLANSQIPGAATQPVVTADQKTVKGIDLTSAITRFVSPTFAVKDGILYLGLSADSVVQAATTATQPAAKDVMHQSAFNTAIHRLAIPDFSSFSFCDLPQTAPLAYETFAAAGEQARKMLEQFELKVPAVELPTLDDIKGHLTPALSVTWNDQKGVYSKSVSPFPFSSWVLGDPQSSLMGSSTLSAATAILVPALQRARDQAMAVQSMSNQRSLLMGTMMYASNHHGTLPPDLGTLISQGLSPKGNLSLFLAPASAIKVPAAVASGTLDEQAEWVNENSDYQYLLAGQKLSEIHNTAQIPALVLKDAEQVTGRSPVGFADGHVEMCDSQRVHELLHPKLAPANP